jgi:hypothetical protein
MLEIKYGRHFLLEEMPKGSVCAEIGVLRGDFSEQILQVVEPKQLHLIDPWHEPEHDILHAEVSDKFKSQVETGQVVIHRARSQDIYDRFADSLFDWIYVDGRHSYNGVKADLDLYYPKVKMYGFITGDDYRFVEKRRGLRDAVAEIAEKYYMRLILIKNNQFILWKKGPCMVSEGPLKSPGIQD